jgi:hypothetical protein
VSNPTPRRDPGPFTKLEPASEDGGDPSEASSSEEVREMRGLHRPLPGDPQELRHGERGGEGAGRAHPKSLTDRELVTKVDLEGTLSAPEEPTRDLRGDR